MTRLFNILFGLNPTSWAAGGSWRVDWLALPRHDRALMLLVALVIGAWGISALYRREGRGVAAWQRWMLTSLRIIALLALVAMLLEPVVVFTKTEWIPSNLIVLKDQSSSMDMRDAYVDAGRAATIAEALKLPGAANELRDRTRENLVDRAIDPNLLEALASGGDRMVKVHAFASDLGNATSATTQASGAPTTGPTFDRSGSAIGSAIRQALAAYRGQPVSGILLATDGQSNAGDPPIKAAESAGADGVPIMVLASGTLEGPRNAKIARIEASPVTYVRDPAAIHVLLESRGLEKTPAAVVLERKRDGGVWEEVARQQVILQEEGQVQSVDFEVKEDRPAKWELRASLAEVGPELTQDDNVALSEMRFVRQRIRALFIAGTSFPEFEFVRNALLRDTGMNASTWLQTADANYEHPGNPSIKRLPQTQEEMNDFDCVVLYDPDPSLWPGNFPELLSTFVTEAGGGLVYVAGERWTKPVFDRPDDPGTTWLRILPVVVEPGLYRSEVSMRLSAREPWKLELTPEAQADSIFRFNDDKDQNAKVLASLPGMYWHFPVTRAKPGATVLARHGDPRMRNEHGGHVLLATQLVGPGRTFFCAFDSTYRWRYLDEELFDGFWARLIDRAGRSKQLGGRYPFMLATDRTSYRPGSQVQLTARFENESERDAGLEMLHGEIETGDTGATPITLNPIAGDDLAFETTFTVDKAGPHVIRVWGGDAELKQGTRAATLQVPVELPNLEFDRPGQDLATLQQIANASGGKLFALDQADQIAEAFKVKRVARVLEDRQEIWDAPALWGFVLLAIFAEWVWRKRVRLV